MNSVKTLQKILKKNGRLDILNPLKIRWVRNIARYTQKLVEELGVPEHPDYLSYQTMSHKTT